MEDTGWWTTNGENWHVVQKSDGSVVCNSDRGHFTAADAKTWEIWKVHHGWKRVAPSPHKEVEDEQQ